MAWEVGNQTRLKVEDVNSRLAKVEGFLEDKDAKLWIYDFLKENTSFAVRLLMGIDLFPFQSMMVKTMMKSDYFLAVLGRGSSKCEKWDNLIWTNEGLKRMIDVEIGDYVQSIKGRNLVLDKTINPKDATYRIQTSHGLVSEGLDYHRVFKLDPITLQGVWTFAKEIQVGDYLICRKGDNFWGEQSDIFCGFSHAAKPNSHNYQPINPYGAPLVDWYYFFGLLIGDGYIHNPGAMIETQDAETIAFLTNFFQKIGLSYRIVDREQSKSKSVICNSVSLVALLKFLGFERKLAHEKSIPFSLLNCNKECASNLLMGLFDTDGHCCAKYNEKKRSTLVEIGFCSSSADLCSQVRNLLLNFNVTSSTRLCFKGGEMSFPNKKTYICRPAYAIDISGFNDINSFREGIGFKLSRKMEKLNKIDGYQYTDGEFSNLIPYVGDFLKKKYNKKSFCFSQKNLPKNISGKRKTATKLTFRDNTSKRWINKCLEGDFLFEEDREKLKSLIQDGIFYSRVISTEKSENVTVDIQVDKEECYVSDGIVSHNTFSCGIFLALYAALNQGVHIGVISASFRQCLQSDSWVFTDKGMVRLKDASIGDSIYSIKGANKILDKWVNPTESGKLIRTKLNYRFEGKNGHKVYRYDPANLTFSYINIEDVKVGDILPIHKNVGYFGDNDMFDQLEYGLDLAYLFGLIVGDGSISKPENGGRYAVTTNDQETIDFIRGLNKTIFPEKELSVYQKKDSNCFSVGISSNHFAEFLDFCGMKGGVTATYKTVPSTILSAPKKYVKEFLRGLMDTDGTVYHNKKKNYCIVDFCTSSLEMAEQVQMLFLNFGITSKLATEKARGNMKIMGVDCYGNTSYKVRLTSNASIKIFAKEIGFCLTRKTATLEGFLQTSNDRGNYDCIPELGTFIRKNSRGASNLPPTIGKKRAHKVLNKDSVLLNDEDREKVLSVLSDDFYFEKVVSVKDVNVETIDIEVENEHCYVGNGFIHHNSKGIMKKIMDISGTPEAKFLHKCITKTSFQNDEWNIEIGQSKITALPLGQGEKLRGFRFQVMVMDELLLMPAKIINEIIIPFLAVVTNPTEREKVAKAETILIEQGKMKEEDRKKWPSNKIIGLSSASYSFEHLYTMYKQYEEFILSGKNKDAHYSIFHMAYDAVPKALYDPALLEKAKEEMSEAQMDREFRSIFVSDSSGFYKISKMMACTYEDGVGECVEAFGDVNSSYILSIDPSWSESESSDYFAMEAIKLDEASESGTLVHPYAIAGGAPKDHIAYFLYLLKNFNVKFMVVDFMGGAQFISSCNESQLFKDAKIEIKIIEVEIENPEEYNKNIQEVRNAYNLTDKRICILRKPSSVWIRSGNELLQRSFDKKDLMFAGMAMDDDFKRQVSKASLIQDLKFMKEEKGFVATEVDFVENLKDLISLTKVQCAMIEVSSTPTGHQTFDLPRNLKQQRGNNRARKDLYSALVLGNWGKKIYFDMLKMPEEDAYGTFEPFIC